MVVCKKAGLQLCKLILWQSQAEQPVINTFCGQHWHIVQAFMVKFLFFRTNCFFQAGTAQAVQDAFHCGVTGQIPQFRYFPALFCQVPQDAVQDKVQVCPVGQCARAQVTVRQIRPAVPQGFPVGGQRLRHLVPGTKTQRAKRRIKVRQIHIEFIAGGKQDVLPDF